MKTFSTSFVALSLLLTLSSNCYSQIVKKRHVVRSATIGNFTLQAEDGTPVTLCGRTYGNITVTNGKISFDVFTINSSTCVFIPATPLSPLTTSSPYKPLVFVENFGAGRTFSSPTSTMNVPFWGITMGLNSLPFRIRKSVEQDGVHINSLGTTAFQLALNVGYTRGKSVITRRGITDYSWTLGVFAGPSVTDLKKETVSDPTTWTTNRTNATITYGANLILARNNLGIVFAWGFENALGRDSDRWLYNKIPYFGFGVNTSFMK